MKRPVRDRSYADEFIYRCPICDESLELQYDYSETAEKFLIELEHAPWNIWCYHSLLAGLEGCMISMSEGGTLPSQSVKA